MKSFIFILLLFLFPFLAFAFDFEHVLGKTYAFNVYYDDFINPGFQFSFRDGDMKLNIPETDEAKIEDGKFIKETRDERYTLSESGVFQFLKTESNKYLVLSDGQDICVLVDLRTKTSFWGLRLGSKYVRLDAKRLRGNWIGFQGSDLSAQEESSHLTETIKGTRIEF